MVPPSASNLLLPVGYHRATDLLEQPVTSNPKEQDSLKAQADAASALLRERKEARGRASADALPQKGTSPTQKMGIGQFIVRNIVYILGVAVVAAIVAVAIIVAAPLIFNDENSELLAENTYVSPYDWRKLNTETGRFAYVDDGETRSRIGVDVSENQHVINWQAVADDGIDFAMIRLGYRGATEGDLYLDEFYETNLAGAEAAGLDCGIYFFSQAITPEEAIEEADFVLEHLRGARIAYPIAFDSEEHIQGVSQSRTSGLDKASMTAVADAFCQRIEEAGYRTLVYGNAHDMSRYRRSSMDQKEIWWAEYGTLAPTNKIDIVLWQYTSSGSVAGIDGSVDLNLDLRNVLDSK